MKYFLFILASYAATSLGAATSLDAAQELARTQILMETVPVTLILDPEARPPAEALGSMTEAFELARRLEARVERLPRLQQKATQLGPATLGYFDRRYGLGGIAKGYIIDQMAQFLRAVGYQHFLINAGGDIWAENKLRRHAWKIELESFPAPLCVMQGALATSGTSERGQHIFDPHSGKPVETNDHSVTVFANTADTADALATAVYAAGPNKTQLIHHLRRQDPSLAFMIIRSNGQVDISGNLDIECEPK